MAAFAAIKRVAKLGTKSGTTALTGFGASKNFPFISGHKHFRSSERRELDRLREAIKKEQAIERPEFDGHLEAIKKLEAISLYERRKFDLHLEALEKQQANFKKITYVCTTAAAFLLVGDALNRKIEESK